MPENAVAEVYDSVRSNVDFGTPGEERIETLQTVTHNGLRHGVGVVTIRGGDPIQDILDRQEEQQHGTMPPALFVPDDRWQEVVAQLMSLAGMVICEMTIESGGVSWEMNQLKALGKENQMVLVLSAPGHGGFRYQNFELYEGFQRLVFVHELNTIPILDHPSVRDLLWLGCYRPVLKTEEHLPPDLAYLSDRRPAYAGVIEGMKRLVEIHARDGDAVAVTMYCQCILNIAAVLAADDLPVSAPEQDAAVFAAMVVAERLRDCGYVDRARQRARLARELALAFDIRGYLPGIDALDTSLMT